MTWKEEYPSEIAMEITKIVLNKEPGWSVKLDEFIQKTREDAYGEGLKENINNLEKTSENYKTLFWCIREDAVRECIEEIYSTGKYNFKNGSEIDISESGIFVKLREDAVREEQNRILSLNPDLKL